MAEKGIAAFFKPYIGTRLEGLTKTQKNSRIRMLIDNLCERYNRDCEQWRLSALPAPEDRL